MPGRAAGMNRHLQAVQLGAAHLAVQWGHAQRPRVSVAAAHGWTTYDVEAAMGTGESCECYLKKEKTPKLARGTNRR